MADRLRVVVDGTPLPEAEARAIWERFSAHMEANPGDIQGFASGEGHATGRVGLEEGVPTLTLGAAAAPAHADAQGGGPGQTHAKREEGPLAKKPAADDDGNVRRRRSRKPGPGEGRGDGTPRREGKPLRDGKPRPHHEAGNAAGDRKPRRGERKPRRTDDPSSDGVPRGQRKPRDERPPRRDAGPRQSQGQARPHTDEGARRPLDGDAPPRRPGGVIRKDDAGTPGAMTTKRGRPRVVDAPPQRRRRRDKNGST